MAITASDWNLGQGAWLSLQQVPRGGWTCGFCGQRVANNRGYKATANSNGTGSATSVIRICPSCEGPTVFTAKGEHAPTYPPGNPVPNVPADLSQLYDEARLSAGAGAFTASVLACRKMLMNIAVTEGAKEGLNFLKYVEYLSDNNFVPPKGKVWVDYIRTRGNEATHEIALMGEQDALALITFVEMLLRFIYEFPNMVPAPPTSTSTST